MYVQVLALPSWLTSSGPSSSGASDERMCVPNSTIPSDHVCLVACFRSSDMLSAPSAGVESSAVMTMSMRRDPVAAPLDLMMGGAGGGGARDEEVEANMVTDKPVNGLFLKPFVVANLPGLAPYHVQHHHSKITGLG